MKTYNPPKLHKELVKAGLTIHGVDSNGKIDWVTTPTTAQKATATATKVAHTETWYVEQRRKAYPSIEDQLDMIYQDQKDTTTKWKDLITTIKSTYPKV